MWLILLGVSNEICARFSLIEYCCSVRDGYAGKKCYAQTELLLGSWRLCGKEMLCPNGAAARFVTVMRERNAMPKRRHVAQKQKTHHYEHTDLTFIGPCNVNIISIVKPTRCTNVSNLFYFGMTLYMFLTVFPSIIRSIRLYIELSNRYCCLLAGRVSFQSKINLIHWCILLVLL